MSSSEIALDIDGLTKQFGGLTAVDNLSFEVSDGEILGFIGPNGAGKSTVFNCIMGTYRVTSGTVTFRGEEVTDEETHEIVNRGLSRVSQESQPLPSFTVEENIRLFTFPNSIRAFRESASDEEVREIASRVGLEDELETKPDSLPHAGIRRLEIAKAIATDPDTLLLDEPFAGLNQAEIRELSEEIRDLRDEGVTIVVVDHNMKGLMALVERVVVLDKGQKLAQGSPEEIAEDERVQQAYLSGEMEEGI